MDTSIKEILIDFFWPTQITCMMCNAELNQKDWICDRCAGEIVRVEGTSCAICGHPIAQAYDQHQVYGYRCKACQEQFHYFSRHRSFGQYNGKLKKALMAFKYSGKTYFASYFSRCLEQAVDADFLRDVTYVVPVPVHFFRRIGRGYNQAALIASEFCKDRETLQVLDGLQRVKTTQKLKKLDKPSRKKALENAIIVKNTYKETLAGEVVLLIDDIFTTGTTLDACARVLYECGVQEIRCLTVAMGISYDREA